MNCPNTCVGSVMLSLSHVIESCAHPCIPDSSSPPKYSLRAASTSRCTEKRSSPYLVYHISCSRRCRAGDVFVASFTVMRSWIDIVTNVALCVILVSQKLQEGREGGREGASWNRILRLFLPQKWIPRNSGLYSKANAQNRNHPQAATLVCWLQTQGFGFQV